MKPKRGAMPPPITLLERQRETLAQALADAVSYRDPPLCCDACETQQGRLCEQCAATLARARAYVDLGREIGVEVP
jgi:hypothetical protein